MTILFRYVAKDFFRYWIGVLTALITLIVIAALLGNIDEAFSSWESFLEFYNKTVKTLPGLIEILLPMTVLLATVMTFSAFSRTSELVAMKASGMGLFRLMLPLFFVLLFVSTFAYLNQNYLYRYLHEDDDESARYSIHQWRTLGNSIIYVDSADLVERTMTDVREFIWEENPFQITQVNTLASGVRTPEDQWDFSDVTDRILGAKGWSLHLDGRKNYSPNDFPDVFKPQDPDAHHSPLLDLYQEIKQRESQGQRVDVMRMEGWQKYAGIIAPFIMVLIGTPLSQFHFRRAKVASEMVVTLLTGLVFMVGTQIIYILGKGSFIPPMPAAFSVNLVFLGLAGMLMRMSR